MSRELEIWVRNEMIEEWWSGTAQDTFCDCSERMEKAGMDTTEIKEILEELYAAAASEFGG